MQLRDLIELIKWFEDARKDSKRNFLWELLRWAFLETSAEVTDDAASYEGNIRVDDFNYESRKLQWMISNELNV